MKIFSAGKFIVLLAVAALGLNLCASAAHATEQGKQERETELGKKMKIIGKSVKELKGQIGDASKQQSSIELLDAAKNAALAAKNLTPDKTKELPEADRPKFITDFQTEIDKLISQIGKVEDAVRAGKYDDAAKLYADLGGIKREGHEKFQADQD